MYIGKYLLDGREKYRVSSGTFLHDYVLGPNKKTLWCSWSGTKANETMVCSQTPAVSAVSSGSWQMPPLQILHQDCNWQEIKNWFSPNSCIKATAFLVILVELHENWGIIIFAENCFRQMTGNLCTDYYRVLSFLMFSRCDTLVLQICVFTNFGMCPWKI